MKAGLNEARGVKGGDTIAEAEARECFQAEGADAFTADFVAGEAVLFDQGDAPASAGEGEGGGGAGGACADDGDLEGRGFHKRHWQASRLASATRRGFDCGFGSVKRPRVWRGRRGAGGGGRGRPFLSRGPPRLGGPKAAPPPPT